ncbi:hypothetical protein BvCms6BK_04180 [Escherichia coli]|nr:hypothetical protein BvCms6BK_04180 [Escherichia coli]
MLCQCIALFFVGCLRAQVLWAVSCHFCKWRDKVSEAVTVCIRRMFLAGAERKNGIPFAGNKSLPACINPEGIPDRSRQAVRFAQTDAQTSHITHAGGNSSGTVLIADLKTIPQKSGFTVVIKRQQPAGFIHSCKACSEINLPDISADIDMHCCGCAVKLHGKCADQVVSLHAVRCFNFLLTRCVCNHAEHAAFFVQQTDPVVFEVADCRVQNDGKRGRVRRQEAVLGDRRTILNHGFIREYLIAGDLCGFILSRNICKNKCIRARRFSTDDLICAPVFVLFSNNRAHASSACNV